MAPRAYAYPIYKAPVLLDPFVLLLLSALLFLAAVLLVVSAVVELVVLQKLGGKGR